MKLFCFSVFIFFVQFTTGQTVINPNFGLKSHPTLGITKIVTNNTQTILYLTVVNENNTEGWFCADKNISVYAASGKKQYKLIKAENIPVCPDSHKFTAAGQKLDFVLYFPKLDAAIKYIDLTEECSNYCFSFKGIILDAEFNTQMNNAYNLYKNNQPEKAITIFESLITRYPDYNYSINYFNLIKIYSELGNKTKANYWQNALINSNCSDKDYFLQIVKNLK